MVSICYNILRLYMHDLEYTLSLFESSRGTSMCYIENGQRVISYGHISCNLIICTGIEVDTPIFIGHAYSNTVDRIKRCSDLGYIKDTCPEIFEALSFARELSRSNVTPYLLTVGEVTRSGKTFASEIIDRVEVLLNTREYVFPINHINPFIVNPDSDSLDISVRMNRPYLEVEVDFHTPHFATQCIPYCLKI